MKQLLSITLLLAMTAAALGQQAQPWLINRKSTATNYTATATDWYIAATATLTNTLPTVASVRNGQAYIFKNSTAGNTLTIRPTGGNTIDGTAGDLTLTDQAEVTLVANGGTNWERAMSFTSTSGTTINPTDGYLPYRSNSTTFGDSPWYRIGAEEMGFSGTSRFLYANTANNRFSFGDGAFANTTGGSDIMALGDLALNLHVNTGSSVLAVGTESLRNATNVNDVVAIGPFAGVASHNIQQTTLLGSEAASGKTNLYSVVAIGKDALSGAASSDVEEVTAVGTSAGEGSSGSYNTLVGYFAGKGTSITYTNMVLLGHKVPPRASNTAQIGTNGISVLYLNGTVGWFRGSGSPEGAVTAGVGSYYTREDGASGTTLYTKTSGTGNTGWEALTTGVPSGASIWTNINGYVTMQPGQAATNTLSFVSGAADNATNILLNVDSANALSADGSLLAKFSNSGTNQNAIGWNGGIYVGSTTLGTWGGTGFGETLVSIRSTTDGDPNFNWLSLGTVNGGIGNEWSISQTTNTFKMETTQGASGTILKLEPTIASSGSAVAYLFDTSNSLTNGDRTISFRNAGTEVATISPFGGYTSGKGVIPFWGTPAGSDGFVAVHDTSLGEVNSTRIVVGTDDGTGLGAMWQLTTTTNTLALDGTSYGGTLVTALRPAISSGTAYLFRSINALTNADSLMLAQNTSGTRFRVDANSGYTGTGNNVLADDGYYTPFPVDIGAAASDETTALTTGTNKVVFRMPHAMTLTGVRASLTTAQASGSIFTCDINENNVSVLSTKITVDNTEKTSTTAATPPVISDSALADDSEIEVDIDQVGDGTSTGLKVWLIGNR